MTLPTTGDRAPGARDPEGPDRRAAGASPADDPGPATPASPVTAGQTRELPDGWVRAEFAAISSCGPVREGNEDRLGWTVLGSPAAARSPQGDGGLVHEELVGPGVAFLVADGLGGHSHGELASRTAIRLLLGKLTGPEAIARASQALRDGFMAANEALLVGELDTTTLDIEIAEVGAGPRAKGAGGHPLVPGGQTTLTALAVTGHNSPLVHVGDCRLFRLRDGLLELLTTDHTQAMELLRMRVIRPDQAAHHPGRHLLTRSIGGDLVLRVEARPLEPAIGDGYLMCSDGLWSAVEATEIRDVLEGDLAEGVARLVELATERGGDDNASVIALRLLDLGGRRGPSVSTAWRLPWRRGANGAGRA
jgi:serine/threonine protein phosphatase PrpC